MSQKKTEDVMEVKPKYTTPVAIPLGEMAKGTGAQICETGSGADGCCQGFAADSEFKCD